jgi:hypothetical protein
LAKLVERWLAKFARYMDGKIGRRRVAKFVERCVAKFGREWLARLVVEMCG